MEPHDLDLISDYKGLRIIHVNTRSVLNKLDELQVKLSKFDVVVLTETWLNSSTSDSILHWNNFQLVRCDRELIRDKRGGGVCIYIKNSISFEVIHDFDKYLDHNLEFVFVKIMPLKQKAINMIGMYRPPDGNPKESIQYISSILDQVERKRSHVLIIGDFNLDFNNKKLISSTKLDTLTSKHSLTQLVMENTRITDSSATCIDLIFTDILDICKAGVINYNISDHLPVFLIKKKIRNKIRKRETRGRSYLHYDKEVFLRMLDNHDWRSFDEAEDPNELWEIFIDAIRKALDTMCPIKNLTVVDKRPDWLSNELIVQMRQRDKLFNKARRTKLPMNWVVAKRLRNSLEMEIKTAKANVIKAKLERHKSNPRKFWQEINNLLPKSQNSTINSLVQEDTGVKIEDDKVADHINEYFATIGSKLAAGCTPGIMPDVAIIQNRVLLEFDRMPFAEDEVLKVCKEINIHKSASIANVKTMVLKHAFTSNIDKTTKIFNSSFSLAIFPRSWKLSTIVPLPKVSQPTSASELRPVALTPLPGKLMEKTNL